MSKLTNIIPVSDLRQDAAKILKKLNKDNEPLIITQRGRAAAVLIGVEAYEKFEHEKELLMLLAKGDLEIEVAEGYDLDTVRAEADAFLTRSFAPPITRLQQSPAQATKLARPACGGPDETWNSLVAVKRSFTNQCSLGIPALGARISCKRIPYSTETRRNLNHGRDPSGKYK